jgi:SAM-dependent methyltransferase
MEEYYNRANPDLLSSIPAGVKRILEFGCGAGALGKAVRASRSQVEYWGVEVSSEAARAARDHLSGVIEADADFFDPLTKFEPASFDLLVYGDVLEHLRDPWETLRRHHALLASGGRVLACIPNVQYWTMLGHLIRGSWQYGRDGLLDKSHLHFFDLNSIILLFENAGFRMESARSRMVGSANDEAAFERVQMLLQPLLLESGVDPADFRTRSRAYQYIVLAQKTEQLPSRKRE